MDFPVRSFAHFSACGLNCGLCPRYQTESASKCPGCGAEGFSAKHPSCGVLSCCQRHGLEYCHNCDELPCAKYANADKWDSFITHKNQFSDMQKAREYGMIDYETNLRHKMDLLKQLLENYDDGRRKSFFCLAVNLLSASGLEQAMQQLNSEADAAPSRKEKAVRAVSLLKEAADGEGVSLQLRKKSSPIE